MLTLPGDNLNNFTVAFEEKPIADEFTKVDSVEAEWGEYFSVLFKATCGEWKNTFYNYGRSLAPKERWKRLKAQLRI